MRKIFILLLFFSFNFIFSQSLTLQLPTRNIHLKGKWKQDFYRQESNQYWYLNKKIKGAVSISFRKIKKMKFYNENDSINTLLDNYYKWDKEYWESNDGEIKNTKVLVIEKNKELEYIILRYYNEKELIDNYSITGIEKGYLLSFSIHSNKFNKEEKIKFLKTLYSDNIGNYKIKK